MGKIPVLRLSALQSASNICRGITVMLFKVLPVFIILTSTKGGKMFPQWIGKDPVSECLLRRTMYHHLTGKCHPPLDQGPCSPGELLLPDSPPGTLKCSPLSLPEFCSANIQSDGEVEFECEGDLDMMYRRGQCGEGELLLPTNFRENTRPCAEGFSCRTKKNSEQYNSALKTLKEKGSNYRVEKQYLKDLVCDFKSHSICLPDDNSDSLFTMKNLLASLKTASARCEVNPCPAGRTPWLSEDGYYRCLLTTPGLRDCPLDCSLIQQDDGSLLCQHLTLHSVAPIRERQCRRRSIWSEFRQSCVKLFG